MIYIKINNYIKLKKGYKRITIKIKGEEITVDYSLNAFSFTEHYEFTTDGANCISETGYQSFFPNVGERGKLTPRQFAIKVGNMLAE